MIQETVAWKGHFWRTTDGQMEVLKIPLALHSRDKTIAAIVK